MSGIKQVIIIRKDLKMRRGKEIAQGAHASLKAILDTARPIKENPDFLRIPLVQQVDISANDLPIKKWLEDKFTKICLQVNSEEELLKVYTQAKMKGIPCALIKDAGLTEFKEPTYTCCAIGPDFSTIIDPITKSLKLY